MRRLLCYSGIIAVLCGATAASAQTPASPNGLGDVLLQLSRTTPAPNQQRVQDTLFSGRVDATIIDTDGDNGNFAGADVVAFGLSSISRGGNPLIFSGTRASFDDWVNENANAILAILFPGSLTESTSGIDVAHGHAQSFLVSTALAAGGRGSIGGRIEYEDFDVEGAPGRAVQGLFRLRAVAIEARYAQLSDTPRTRSTNIGVNVHPSWGRSSGIGEVRIGGDGYFNTLYSSSRAIEHLGSFDYGAGVWASGRREIARTSISAGGMLLGSKSYIPLGLIDDDFDFVARVINDRAMRWDFTYGGAVQYKLSELWVTGFKALQSVSVKSPLDQGRTSQLVLLNLGYIRGGDSLLDFGYRYSRGGARYQAHGLFMNANLRF